MFEKVDKKTRHQLEQHMRTREIDLEGVHKAYILKQGSIKKLHHKIDHYGSGPMVKFSAKMNDLLCAKTTRDIKKGRKISQE